MTKKKAVFILRPIITQTNYNTETPGHFKFQIIYEITTKTLKQTNPLQLISGDTELSWET